MKKRGYLILCMAGMLLLGGCGNAKQETEETHTGILYEDLTSQLVHLGEYKGIKAARTVQEVTDEQVEEEVQKKKKEHSELVDAEREAQTGDVLVIDFTGYVDGETSDGLQGTNQRVEIGSRTFLEEFEDQLIGAAAGEDRKLNFTFPENYSKEVAGKDVEFDVHVYSVQEYRCEDWGDAFVKETFGYDSEQALRASIRQDLENDAAEDADEDWQYELIYTVLEGCEYEIEEADEEAYIDEMMKEYEVYADIYSMEVEELLQQTFGMSVAQMRENYRETAQFRVKMTLTFHDIAETEGMQVSEEAYEARLNELAEQYQYEDPKEIEEIYGKAMIEEELLQSQVIELIKENAGTIE